MKTGDRVKVKGPNVGPFATMAAHACSGTVKETWRDAHAGPLAAVELDNPPAAEFPRETFKIEDLEAV